MVVVRRLARLGHPQEWLALLPAHQLVPLLIPLLALVFLRQPAIHWALPPRPQQVQVLWELLLRLEALSSFIRFRFIKVPLGRPARPQRRLVGHLLREAPNFSMLRQSCF